MDPVSWALLIAIALALGAMVWSRWGWRLRRGGTGGRRRGRAVPLGPVLGSHGAMRCIAAVGVLQALATQDDGSVIVDAWEQLEGPLLQALPDCPPDRKLDLADALAACSAACPNRAAAQAMMTLRNGLVADGSGG